MRSIFVLVHGAWTGGWCWKKLQPLLEAEGHTVIAPDMPGHGDDRSPIEEQNLDTYSRAVEALVEQLNGSVILVGHSFGGMITSQAACHIPSKIKKLIYVAAFLPRNGQSCVEITKSIKPTFHEKLEASGYGFIISADGKTSKVVPDSCVDFIYNDIPKDEARLLAERLCPESNAAQNQAVVLNEKFYGIPKAYVRCLYDQVVEVSLQDKMIAETYCNEIYTLETGHCPFESAPRRLAEILLSMSVRCPDMVPGMVPGMVPDMGSGM